MNPYTKANWTYLVDVAKAAGKVGFDEIQFDYVRFPTDGDLTNVKLNRTKAKMEANIAAFLQYAVDELHPLKLRVSADLFGLAATRDLGIGQNPRQIAKIVDVMSPMIYPQGYSSGEYNIDCPVCNPRDLVLADDARLAEGDRRRHRRAAPVDPGLRLARPSVRARADRRAGRGRPRVHRARLPVVGRRLGVRPGTAASSPPRSERRRGSRPRARAPDPRLPRRRLLRRRLRLDEVTPRREPRAVPVRARAGGARTVRSTPAGSGATSRSSRATRRRARPG